jgi:pimeloyl-ACP methyl ester carboxylesterase
VIEPSLSDDVVAPHVPPRIVYTAPTGRRRRRPLLFVHGVFHGAWCFQEHFAPYFASHGHPCFALTLRGHEEGDGPCRVTRAEHVADIREALERLPAETLPVGHSLGGMLLRSLLSIGAIRDAVLLATPTPGALLRRAILYTLKRPLVMLPSWLRFDSGRAYHDETFVADNFFSQETPPELVARHLEKLRAVSYGRWTFLRTLFEAVPAPPTGSTRVLVVGGANDPTCTPKTQAKIARAYGGKPVIVEGVSHDLMLEPRWRAAADVVRAWVEETR